MEEPRVVSEFKVGITDYRLIHDGIKYQLHINLNTGNDLKRWARCEDISHVLARRLEDLADGNLKVKP